MKVKVGHIDCNFIVTRVHQRLSEMPAIVMHEQMLLQRITMPYIANGSVSQKNIPPPPDDLWQYFQNGWEFFNQILHAYYAFLSTLDYECLFNYLQV